MARYSSKSLESSSSSSILSARGIYGYYKNINNPNIAQLVKTPVKQKSGMTPGDISKLAALKKVHLPYLASQVVERYDKDIMILESCLNEENLKINQLK
jgi:archaellin